MDTLYHDPDLARFYDWDNRWTADFDWFLSLLQGAGSVLDLGCGTGIFSVAAARAGAGVVGVDPAVAMLDIARSRPGGDLVRWVTAGAAELDLGQRFDAVVMTGHAFQTLLTPEERATCLATIARHLTPGGRFFFDSRNSEARAWTGWTPEITRQRRAHPEFGQVTRWIDATWDAATRIVTYETHYALADGALADGALADGRHFAARSRIGFPAFEVLAAETAAAGLTVDRWYGDAAGGPLRKGCADFIPLGRLAGQSVAGADLQGFPPG